MGSFDASSNGIEAAIVPPRLKAEAPATYTNTNPPLPAHPPLLGLKESPPLVRQAHALSGPERSLCGRKALLLGRVSFVLSRPLHDGSVVARCV